MKLPIRILNKHLLSPLWMACLEFAEVNFPDGKYFYINEDENSKDPSIECLILNKKVVTYNKDYPVNLGFLRKPYITLRQENGKMRFEITDEETFERLRIAHINHKNVNAMISDGEYYFTDKERALIISCIVVDGEVTNYGSTQIYVKEKREFPITVEQTILEYQTSDNKRFKFPEGRLAAVEHQIKIELREVTGWSKEKIEILIEKQGEITNLLNRIKLIEKEREQSGA